MKHRWIIYLLIGLLFGLFDFYYHGLISGVAGGIAWSVLALGIWLVPVIPVALYEARVSQSKLESALACLFLWCASIFSYYLTNAVQLAFLGVPGRPELHISNRNDPFFWENWASVFRQDIIGAIADWMMLAMVGGLIAGFVTSSIYLYLSRKIEE